MQGWRTTSIHGVIRKKKANNSCLERSAIIISLFYLSVKIHVFVFLTVSDCTKVLCSHVHNIIFVVVKLTYFLC